MTGTAVTSGISGEHLNRMRRRARLLLLLDAAERASITPLAATRLHAFAYLADVLSPVWDLVPFDGKIYKSNGAPHYPELQDELDQLVILGLVEIHNLRYVDRGVGGARMDGEYALNFESPHLRAILEALGAIPAVKPIDPGDVKIHSFLVELAGALAMLPDEQIDIAASVDVTYRRGENLFAVVDFADWAEDRWESNPSWRTAERFQKFLPAEASLSPGEKIYLYATYLGRAMHAA